MSEENTVDAESETPEVSPAENFINAVTAKDYVAASKEFEEMMLGKVDDALEQEKVNLAGQVFNGEEPPEEKEEDEYDEEDHIENDAEDESDEESEEESPLDILAKATTAFEQAQEQLQKGNLGKYQELIDQAQKYVDLAIDQLNK